MPFRQTRILSVSAVALVTFIISGCVSSVPETAGVPADKFDLDNWNITVPVDILTATKK